MKSIDTKSLATAPSLHGRRSATKPRLVLQLLMSLLMVNAADACAAAGQVDSKGDRPSVTSSDASPRLAPEISLTEPSMGQPPRPAAPAKAAAGLSSSTWEESRSDAAAMSNGKAELELSIEPGTLPLLPEDAPAWVGRLPDVTDDVHRLFVGGQIADSESEAAEGLDTALVAAVSQYLDEHLIRRPGAAQSLTRKITADYVWKNLIDDRAGYIAKLNTAGQPLYQKWITVSVTPEQRAVMLRWNREAVQRERLAPIGLGLMSLLGSVGIFHLLLRRGKIRAA